MAPVTQLGLVFLTTASVAFAERHAHVRGHRHVNRRQNRPYLTAPYGFTNGTVTVGPTGTGSVPDETSTRTQTLTSTITQTRTAPGGGATGEVPVEGDSAPTCGGTQYVTVTESVTVTASAGSPSTTPDTGDDEDEGEDESPVTSSSSSAAPSSSAALPSYAAPSAPVANNAGAEQPSPAPAPEATPSGYEAPAAVPSTPSSSSEPVAYSPPASYEAPAPSSSALTTRDVPSATSSAAAGPTGGYSGNTGSTGLRTKRGCLYQSGLNECAALASGGKLSWITNWSDKPDGKSGDMTFIPQLWGKTHPVTGYDYTNGWQDSCKKALDNGSPAILGFNEPEVAMQANLDAGAALAVWNKEIIEPFGNSGKIIVSPGISSQQENGVFKGMDWLSSFAAAGAKWDATAVHMYANCNSDADEMVGYLRNMVNEALKRFDQKPVWVTEFGCEPATPAPADKEAAFMSAAIEYLENEPKVQQYAAFKADVIAGQPIGNTYASMDSKTPA